MTALPELLSPLPIQHFVDSNGNALTGGKLFTYAAGTVTKQTTYTDATGATPNANPIILNTRGEAAIWLNPSQSYKFVLSPSTDGDPPTNPIWTVDNISASGISTVAYAFATTTALIAAFPSGFTLRDGTVAITSGRTVEGTGGATFYYNASDTTSADNSGTIRVDAAGRRWYIVKTGFVNVLWFGAVGDGVTDDTAAFVAALATKQNVYVPGSLWTFNVTTNSLTVLSSQTLFGDGMKYSVVKSFSSTGSILTIGGQVTAQTFMFVRDISIQFDNSVARSAGQKTVRISNAFDFRLDRVDMLNGLINLQVEDALIYTVYDCRMRNGSVGVNLVPSVTYEPAMTLFEFEKCRITGNISKAVQGDGSGTLEFDQGTFRDNDIEGNGANGSGLNVFEITNIGVTGIMPGITMIGNWFENNLGSRDLSLQGNNTNSGFILIGNDFLSTAPTAANISLATGIVYGGGNSAIAAGPTNNVVLAADTTGSLLSDNFSRVNNLGSVILTIAQGAHVQAQSGSGLTAPNSTGAFTMGGSDTTITPTKSGIVQVTISGTVVDASDTTVGHGIAYQISYGTGTPPIANAALTGTQVGVVQTYTAAVAPTAAADVAIGFSISAVITGLAVGTAVWLDLAQKAIGSASQYSFGTISISAVELS